MKSESSLSAGRGIDLNTLLLVPAGTLALCLLSQLAIPLPFTPVPITGQTFVVALNALLLGRKRALAAFLIYAGIGSAGLPVFAMGTSGLHLGPTLGYLVGMAAATWVIGALADQGRTRTFIRAWLAAMLGSALIFAFGLVGLSVFVPAATVFKAGLIPFIPGDLIKMTLAASVASTVRKKT